MERVFVTGFGIISSLGKGAEATLCNLLNNKTGLSKRKYLDNVTDDYHFGVVPYSNGELSEMLSATDPVDKLRTVLLGIAALKEALEHANLSDEEIKQATFINGTTVGGMDRTEKVFKEVINPDTNVSSLQKLKYNDCGYTSNLIGDFIGNFKYIMSPSTACSSAANAIILGTNLIRLGVEDMVIVGGTESLTKFHIGGFGSLSVLDKENCKPFDSARKGINLGEGAAYLVLENKKSLKRRKVKPLSEISGIGNRCDAFHQTTSSDNGEGAYLSMMEALRSASLKPSDIGYINAHGTGTPNNDASEYEAMKRIWGDELPLYSSTKGFTGHTTSAAGAIEAVICNLALLHNFIPGNYGWRSSESRWQTPVEKTVTNVETDHILNNSFAFGGNDSSIIISRCRDIVL